MNLIISKSDMVLESCIPLGSKYNMNERRRNTPFLEHNLLPISAHLSSDHLFQDLYSILRVNFDPYYVNRVSVINDVASWQHPTFVSRTIICYDLVCVSAVKVTLPMCLLQSNP